MTPNSICSLNFFFSFRLFYALLFFYPNKRPCFSRWLYHFSYINLKRADENRLLRQMRNGTTPKNQRTDSKRKKKICGRLHVCGYCSNRKKGLPRALIIFQRFCVTSVWLHFIWQLHITLFYLFMGLFLLWALFFGCNSISKLMYPFW